MCVSRFRPGSQTANIIASWLTLSAAGASAASIVPVSAVVAASSGRNELALFPADDVDRPVAGGPDDPRLRVLRQPEAPGVHGTDQRVVDDVLGERDVGRAQDPGQRADQVRVLLPEQVLDQLRR